MMWLKFVISSAIFLHSSFAFKARDVGSPVANLWSRFDLELHDAVFESLHKHERARRATQIDDYWTGFIPELYQHREQLVIDSVQVLSTKKICPDSIGSEHFTLDSLQHNQQVYTLVTCGNTLSLYQTDSSTLNFLHSATIDGIILSLAHVKLFNSETGNVMLFVLILTPNALKVYQIQKDKLEFSVGQQLLHEYRSIEVFETHGAVYCVLIKKIGSNLVRPGIFSLDVTGNRIQFSLKTSASPFDEDSLIQICTVDGQGHLFHSDANGEWLNIHFFDNIQLKHHQKIKADGIMDIECFRTGATHYLALSTLHHVNIYHFVDGFYDSLQSLTVEGVSTIKALSPPTYRDDTVLLIGGFSSTLKKDFVDLLILNATTLTFLPLQSRCSNTDDLKQLPRKLKSSDVDCIATLTNGDLKALSSVVLDDRLLLVASNGLSSWLLTVNVHFDPVKNPIVEEILSVQEHMERTTSVAKKVNTRSQEILEFSKGIVLRDSDVKFKGSWKAGKIEVPEISLESLNQKVDFNPEFWIPGLDTIVNDIQKRISELESLLNVVTSRLKETVDGSENAIQFGQLVIEGSLIIEQLEATKLSITKMNGLDFNTTTNDIVRLDSDRMIESIKITGTLVADSVDAERINGILVSDIVNAKDEDAHVNGNFTIRTNSSISGDLKVHNTVNGIDMAQVLTSHDIHDFVVFTEDTVINSLSVGEYLNGVHAMHVIPNVIVNQTIEAELGQVHFDHLVIDGDMEIESGLVNSVDFADLNLNALWLNKDQLAEGSMIFTNGITVQKLLKVETINGIQFEDFIMKNSSLDSVTMTGEKIFLGNVSSRILQMEGRVNGHHLHNAVTLDTNQTFLGALHLQSGFTVPHADLSITTVNQIDWEVMRDKGVHPAILERQGLGKNVTFRNLCSIGGSLTAAQFKVNGEKLDDVLSDVVYTNTGDIIMTGHKTFTSLKVNGLQMDGYINGLKVLDEILTSNTDQSITGLYDFQSFVDFSSLDVKGHLNNYNLDELLESILQFDGDLEDVSCRLRFNHLFVSDQLQINGSINGFPTDVMVLDGVDQNFTASQKLVSPDFSSLTVKGNLILTDPTSQVNGLDLELFDSRRASISTDQWIRGNWKLNNFSADSLSFQTLNGLSVKEWDSSFIRSRSAKVQEIHAETFEVDSIEVMGNVTTSLKKIGNYSMQDLSKVAGDIRKNLTFGSNVTFSHFETKEVIVGTAINGYSLQTLKDDVIYNGQEPVINGVKTFKNLRVKENVATELINGRSLIDSYLHFSADQNIETPIKFTDQVTAENLNLQGSSSSLNGVPNQLLFSSSHTLTHNIYKGDVLIDQPVNVDLLEISSLHGEDWNQIISSLARLNESNNFGGSVTFIHPVEVKGSITVDSLNGIDLKKFVDEVVLVDVDANITSRKVFEEVEAAQLLAGSVQCDTVYPDVLTTTAQAIRVDVSGTVNRTLYFDTLAIKRNIQLATLNGQSFPSGFITLDSDQELPESLTLEKLVMLGDITFEDGARVNGYDLSAECANTWMIDGQEKVQSTKVFQGQVQIKENIVVNEKINGKANFNREVVKMNASETLYGAPQFMSLVVSGDVMSVGLTNDIDLAELATQSVYSDEPINTAGIWSAKNISLQGKSFLLPIEAKINDEPFNVGELSGIFDRSRPHLLKIEEENIYNAAIQWHDALRHAYFKLDHLDLNQTIALPHQVTALSELQVNDTSILFIGTKGGSMIYLRKPMDSSYSLVAIPPETGSVSKWLTLSPDYVTSLSTAGTKLWQISSLEPFRIDLIKNFGSDVLDITDEAIVGLRATYSENVTKHNPALLSMPGLQVYERYNSPTEISSLPSSFSSSMKLHSFRLGSKLMIALIMTYSADISANVIFCPGVQLYSTSTGLRKLEHIIPACDVRAITTFTHGNLPDNYLVLAEQDSVAVYHYEGASGFVQKFQLPYPSASALHSWSVKAGKGTELLVAVGKADRVTIHQSVTVGDYVQD